MKIVFRVNYHTTSGQSLWLLHSTAQTGHEVAMQWINSEQWEVQLEFHDVDNFPKTYHYQLRQENGVELGEWKLPRIINHDSKEILRLDTWCSAGTVDYAFETKVFDSILLRPSSYEEFKFSKNKNYIFQLRMAAVPLGFVPCLIGSVDEIGNWDGCSAIPLQETSANVWQTVIDLPADQDIEYKYGLMDLSLGRAVSLELGENRKISTQHHTSQQLTYVSDECYRRDTAALFKGAGIAIPVFSLRSQQGLGVGEFADLKRLADWACDVGLKLIQILPINDTTSANDWTDSYPYSAISGFALHPLYLRLEDLKYPMPDSFHQELNMVRDHLNRLERIDYEAVMAVKWKLTRQIFIIHCDEILAGDSFKNFIEKNREWVIPYAVFCVNRDYYGTADFSCWGEESTYDQKRANQPSQGDYQKELEVDYYLWLQSELDFQLADAVDYLHEKGLALKGDLPIGVDRHSVEAWSAPQLFKMDSQTGAPPDSFTLKGQNWGFPTYHWDAMERDGYAWWRNRFVHLSRYFDAYRIDHILGFFRIWQIPYDQVEGIMGYFDPAIPIHIDEIRALGIHFDHDRFCCPYISKALLKDRLGDRLHEVIANYFDENESGKFRLRKSVSNQRKIERCITDKTIKELLFDCISNVLLFEVPESDGKLYHPRCLMQMTTSFQDLDSTTQHSLNNLYVDYFYHRQEDFWQAQGYDKLPMMRQASRMLLCGEDLGMVPECVPNVMQQLGILSLEIQRMPKTSGCEFYHPKHVPYMSVVSSSTHDMSPLRAWWKEDPSVTARYSEQMLDNTHAGENLSSDIATKIIAQHLESRAMWSIFPLQDLLAMDEKLSCQQPEMERINVPAITPYYWRYRMHLCLDELIEASEFNDKLKSLILKSNR